MCLPLFLSFWVAVRVRCAACTLPAAYWWRTSFTLGLLPVLWNAYARRDGEERIHSFRLLFGAGMMGGYTTYSSIAAVLAQTIFLPYTVHEGYMVLAVLVLLVGGLVAAAAGMLTGRFVASRLVPARDGEEGR